MDACVRAFAAGIEPRDACAGAGIDVDAAHKVVVAWEDGDKILGHVDACVFEVLIYHRESAPDKIGVFVGDIEIELV